MPALFEGFAGGGAGGIALFRSASLMMCSKVGHGGRCGQTIVRSAESRSGAVSGGIGLDRLQKTGLL
jgi:hypothetical protein